MSVPYETYQDCLRELAALRDDHVTALQREVEARQAALNMQQQSRELRSLRGSMLQLQTELFAAK